MSKFNRITSALVLAGALVFGATGIAAAQPAPVFNVDVALMSGNVFDGVGYVWEYKVSVMDGNNRALSHWVLELCPEWFEADPPSFIDQSFFSANTWTTPTKLGATGGDLYEVEYGVDPPTGGLGIKYNFTSGNALDAPGEFDFFSFRLTHSFDTIARDWIAKDGNVPDDFGSVLGPKCDPGTPIPEPATLLLLGGGLLGGAMARRRKRG